MQHIQLLSTLWLSGFFMYPSDHYFLWKHLKRRRREGRKRTHRGRMGRRESNRAIFSFKNLGMVKSVTYDKGPKMKRDTRLKAVFFKGRKRTHRARMGKRESNKAFPSKI